MCTDINNWFSLSTDIAWPDAPDEISPDARSLTAALLTRDPNMRPGAKAIKRHPFFANLDFAALTTMHMPFVPAPSSSTDTSYFERMAFSHMPHSQLF